MEVIIHLMILWGTSEWKLVLLVTEPLSTCSSWMDYYNLEFSPRYLALPPIRSTSFAVAIIISAATRRLPPTHRHLCLSSISQEKCMSIKETLGRWLLHHNFLLQAPNLVFCIRKSSPSSQGVSPALSEGSLGMWGAASSSECGQRVPKKSSRSRRESGTK